MNQLKLKWALGMFLAAAAVSGAVYGWDDVEQFQGPQNPTSGASAGEGFSTCGGEIPWPFQVSNQAVELADGERYLLMGEIEVVEDKAFFIVDLERHAWLNGARRKANPRYPLKGNATDWSKYAGKRVRLVAMAKWIVFRDPAMRGYRVDVILQSLADPAVATRPGAGASRRPKDH
jgi:hypothetical protein